MRKAAILIAFFVLGLSLPLVSGCFKECRAEGGIANFPCEIPQD